MRFTLRKGSLSLLIPQAAGSSCDGVSAEVAGRAGRGGYYRLGLEASKAMGPLKASENVS